MKYHFIRDSTKKNEILNIISELKKEKPETKLLKVIRNCKLTIRIYFQINENETIYFDIYYPSQFALNEMETEKETNKKLKGEN